jgi:immunity protein, SdpI family
VRKWYAPLVLAAAIIVSIVAYPRLPERVPVHWDFAGDVDRVGSRLEAVALLPLLGIVLWLALRALPRIDPRRENYAKFQGTYDLVVNGAVTMIVVLHLALVASGLGIPIPVSRVVTASLGAMFILLGNVLPRARPNWWFGIRTPWTLSNDRVWVRTHRIAGYLLVIAGIVCVVGALVTNSHATHAILLGTLLAAPVGSVVYSYFAWRQETSR